MTAALERDAVGQLMTGWDETIVPIAWPNRKFSPPNDKDWVRITVRNGDAHQTELGPPGQVVHRHVGVLFASVFSPENKGDKRALDLADQLATRFRRARVSFTNGSVLFRTPSIRPIGMDGAFYQVNVVVPFLRDYFF